MLSAHHASACLPLTESFMQLATDAARASPDSPSVSPEPLWCAQNGEITNRNSPSSTESCHLYTPPQRYLGQGTCRPGTEFALQGCCSTCCRRPSTFFWLIAPPLPQQQQQHKLCSFPLARPPRLEPPFRAPSTPSLHFVLRTCFLFFPALWPRSLSLL